MSTVESQITNLTQPFIQVLIKEKKSKLRVTGLCERNSSVTGEFPAQRDSNAENVSISLRHHAWLLTNHPTLSIVMFICLQKSEMARA